MSSSPRNNCLSNILGSSKKKTNKNPKMSCLSGNRSSCPDSDLDSCSITWISVYILPPMISQFVIHPSQNQSVSIPFFFLPYCSTHYRRTCFRVTHIHVHHCVVTGGGRYYVLLSVLVICHFYQNPILSHLCLPYVVGGWTTVGYISQTPIICSSCQVQLTKGRKREKILLS